MTPRTGLAVLALVLLLPFASGESAPTHPGRVTLKVTPKKGAHGCPSEKELQRAVTAILGYSPFRTQAPRRVTSVLSKSGSTLHAHIELLDARSHKRLGVRELTSNGPTCEELGQAMALAIALAIDPLAHAPPARPAALLPQPPVASVTPTPGQTAVALGVGAAAPATAPAGPMVGGGAAARPPAVASHAERPELVAEVVDAGVSALAAEAVPPTAAVAEVVDAGVPALAVEALPPTAAVPDAGPFPLAAEAALDAGTAAAKEATADAGVPPADAAASEVKAAPPAAAETPREAPAGHGVAGAGVEWTAGLVPRHAFGVLLHGGVEWSFASVELEAQWLPSTSLAFAPGSISSTLVLGALVGCARFGGFGACGLFETGPLTSHGTGYPQSQSQTTWAVAVGVRGQWDWVFAHPVGLRLQADGLLNLVRTRLLVGPDVVWQAPSLAFALGAGLFIVF